MSVSILYYDNYLLDHSSASTFNQKQQRNSEKRNSFMTMVQLQSITIMWVQIYLGTQLPQNLWK